MITTIQKLNLKKVRIIIFSALFFFLSFAPLRVYPGEKNKLIPDISFILDVSALYRDMKDEEFERLEIPSFKHSIHEHNEGHDHGQMNSKRGFNLNYGELSLSSAVDPYFELNSIFHLTKENFEIEEAYINTISLPFGFAVKLGRFLSDFGRLNNRHAHNWDFADAPLVYQSFFGEHNLLENGVQLGWVAPLDTYLYIGGEVLSGENENSFGKEGFESYSSGSNETVSIEAKDGPNLFTAFVKTSFDIGDLTMLFGFSGAYGEIKINHDLDSSSGEERHAIKGRTWIAGSDLTLKYQIDSYRYFSIQGEYIYRDLKGRYWELGDSHDLSVMDIIKKQSGFYVQFVVKPFRLWRMGLRYDMFHLNEIEKDNEKENNPDKLFKASAMVDFNPTEFSRLRIQYNYDETGFSNDKRKPNHEVILHVNMIIGTHKAHRF